MLSIPFVGTLLSKSSDAFQFLWGFYSRQQIPSRSDDPINSKYIGFLFILMIKITFVLHLAITDIKISKSSSLFALLIGINEYTSSDVQDLRGAIADAEAFKTYLGDYLGTPMSQIVTLYNRQATRQAIIKQLHALRDDSRIQPGDAIVIFYAGHGGEATIWNEGDQDIQLLIPHDYEEDDKRRVDGIPDRTIGALLEQIAEVKGNNITVILDCCHSGSLTRNPTSSVRGIGKVKPVSPDLDQDILDRAHDGSRSTAVASGFLRKGLSSHVLLAACSAKETAKEAGRGAFSKALLDTLVTVGADKVTYTELVQRIPCLPEQNPQCEGHNQNRICFNSVAPDRSRPMYHVQRQGQSYTVDAGAAHGITEGAVFSVYKDRHTMSPSLPVAQVTASVIGAFSSTVVLTSDDPQFEEGYALQIRVGKAEDLRIHITEEETTKEKLKCVHRAFEAINDGDSFQPRLVLVDREKAELDIVFDKDRIAINVLDPLVTVYGFHQIPHSIRPTAQHAYEVLRAASHYYRHFRRTGNYKTSGGFNQIEIELTRLKHEIDGGALVLKPTGPNLIEDGVVDLVVDKDSRYGIKITNKSNVPLYPSVFFFEICDFAITPYFKPPTAAGRVEPPLQPSGSLTIGYGSGGARPFAYFLEDSQDVDVGFLKFFISDKPVDLSYLEQASPFNSEGGQDRKTSRTRNSEGRWLTILIPVVQRRPRAPPKS